MQLPKKPHSPQSYKKKPISKESQRVNGSTRNQIIEISRFRDFERAEAIVLTSLTSLTS